jgi:hypothetical protein
MAINPIAVAAAAVAGVAVGLGTSQTPVQNLSPYAPGVLAIALGVGATALAKNGGSKAGAALSAAGFAAMGVGGILLYEGYQSSKVPTLGASTKTAGMVGMSPVLLPPGAFGNPIRRGQMAGMSPVLLPPGAFGNPIRHRTANVIPSWKQRDPRVASRYGFAHVAGPYTITHNADGSIDTHHGAGLVG